MSTVRQVDPIRRQIALGDVAAPARAKKLPHVFEDASDVVGGVVGQHMPQADHIEGSWFQPGVPSVAAVHIRMRVAGFVEQRPCRRNGIGLTVDADDATTRTDDTGHLESNEARAASQVQDVGAVGDARELPPVGFAFTSRLGHEAISLDLTLGQRQCIPAELAISHRTMFAELAGKRTLCAPFPRPVGPIRFRGPRQPAPSTDDGSGTRPDATNMEKANTAPPVSKALASSSRCSSA
jgi:hypothetical protein